MTLTRLLQEAARRENVRIRSSWTDGQQRLLVWKKVDLEDGVMADWSAWRRFPDFRTDGYPEAPTGPGVYELRNRSTGALILVGESKTLSRRMRSLLPRSHGGRGRRNNAAKREYVAEHLPDVEYRTCACATKPDAKKLQDQLLATRPYRFPT